ncbi:MAG TPA: ferric reductase-like transmembrane domain-containing protein [Anaeromyxobacteraceae bacterium]|nr:ferric reductase-like transmembrane domain-containing protein [Anaeromyxobacteraceae bacterium]
MPNLRDLTRAGLWIGLYVLLALWPLLLLLAAPAPWGGGFSEELASALGFLALSVLAMQLLLTARFQWLAPPFGTDLVYAFHRWVTGVALAFALVHPVLLFGSALPDALRFLWPWSAPWEVALGVWSTYALLALALTSFLRKRLRLPYELWRRLHGPLAAAAIVIGLWHAVLAGRLLSRPVVRWLWLAWTLGWVGLLLHVRLVKPLWLRRRPWKVVEVRPERNRTVTLALEPDGHAGFRFRSGQFVWLTLGDSPFAAAEHPFSISSSSQAAPRVELSVKAIGDFSRRLQETQVGAAAFLDGPYGSMSIDSFPDVDGYVFIAGGIGVAPCLSMIRTLADRGDRRPHLLVYGTADWERTTFRDELAALQRRLDLKVVHVLEAPPEAWPGERGLVTEALLDRWLPRGGRHGHFVCGPAPMMDAVEAALARLGVPLADLHAERFDLV